MTLRVWMMLVQFSTILYSPWFSNRTGRNSRRYPSTNNPAAADDPPTYPAYCTQQNMYDKEQPGATREMVAKICFEVKAYLLRLKILQTTVLVRNPPTKVIAFMGKESGSCSPRPLRGKTLGQVLQEVTVLLRNIEELSLETASC